MKKLLLILLVLIMPIALADNEFGNIISGENLIITDVDVKVDDLMSRNLDYGEEISRKAEPNSKIIFQIEVKNNHSSLDMFDVEMFIEIEDLDLEDATDEFQLNADRDKNLELTFTLPPDAEDRDYDILVEVRGELNNTIHKVRYDLDLVVEDEEETVTSRTSSCVDSIEGLNRTVTELTKKTNYFEPYTTCSTDLETCEGKIEIKDTEITNLQDFKTKFESCDGDKNILNTQITTLQNENKKLAINNTAMIGKAKGTSDVKIYQIGIGLAILAFIAYQIKKKYKPSREVDTSDTSGR